MVWSQQTNYELCLVKSPALLCRVTPLEEGGCGCWHSPHMLVFVCQVIIRPAFGCIYLAQKTCAAVLELGRSKDTRNMTWMVVTIESWGFFY